MGRLSSHLAAALVSLCAVGTIALFAPTDAQAALADCVPIAASASLDAKACCKLDPFSSICTAAPNLGAGDVTVTSTPGGSAILALVSNATNGDMASAQKVLEDNSKTVTLSRSNPSAQIFIMLPGLRSISASYDLIEFNDPQNNFAVNGRITTSQPLCQEAQMVGSLGIPALFVDATCIQICDGGECGPWTYCALPHKDLSGAAWFAVTIKSRMFYLTLLTTDVTNTQFSVTTVVDCFQGGNDIETTGGTVQLQENGDSFEVVVTFVSWGGTSIHTVQTPQVVLKFNNETGSAVEAAPVVPIVGK